MQSERINSEKIQKIVNNMLENAFKHIREKISTAVQAADITEWDEDNNPYVIPKGIIIALLNNEAEQYCAKGTSHEKQIKKIKEQVKNSL